MTKLEEKLKKLGYHQSSYKQNEYYKTIRIGHSSRMVIAKGKIVYADVHPLTNTFPTQRSIDDLQESYNEMKIDFEILKECEE